MEKSARLAVSILGADAVETLYQPPGEPRGASNARRELCRIAAHKHGPGHIFYSLDDDIIPYQSALWAMELFEDPSVGMVATRNVLSTRPEAEDKQFEDMKLFHCFMFRSNLFFEGLNYAPDEHLDEVEFSMAAWFAGWRLLRTKRCHLPHRIAPHATSSSGGIGQSLKDGIKPMTHIWDRYVATGLVRAQVAERKYRDPSGRFKDVVLPAMNRLYATDKGRQLHEDMRRARWG